MLCVNYCSDLNLNGDISEETKNKPHRYDKTSG